MKLKYTFEIVEMDDEKIAVPINADAGKMSAVIKLNSTAADIFNLLKEETTEEAILSELTKKYNSSSKDEIASYLHDFLVQLSENSMLA